MLLPLIVEDCLKLQHYCLDIIGNCRLRFINCNVIIFFQFKFSLTILCTLYHKAVNSYCVTYAHTQAALRIYLCLISCLISKQRWVNTLRVSCWPPQSEICILINRASRSGVISFSSVIDFLLGVLAVTCGRKRDLKLQQNSEHSMILNTPRTPLTWSVTTFPLTYQPSLSNMLP